MASLSKSDAAFLKKHGISPADAFDGSGLTTREIRARLKQTGKLVAYGKQCSWGHSLYMSNGCIVCDTARIAFGLRSKRAGFVYIAKSYALRLLKAGFSENPSNRIYIANLEGYGGACDWEIRRMLPAKAAGRIEVKLKQRLKLRRRPVLWYRNGRWLPTDETFACTLAEVDRVLEDLLTEKQHSTMQKFRAHW